MSSIDVILDILRKNLEEKKQPLNEQYEITSTWLAKELDIVRKLVQQDFREPIQDDASKIPEPAAGASVPANISKKRKSPETSSEIKLSPEQKRSSVDIKDLLVAAGLPADLNKLKKETLLDELVKRGVNKFTMKNLKNELIDALENAITSEKRNSFKADVDAATSMAAYENVPTSNISSVVEMSSASSDSTNHAVAPASAAKPRVRQGSLMEEFRKKVYNTNANDAEVDQKVKIENEFRNRQERHRDSIAARKSQILEAPGVSQQQMSMVEESEVRIEVSSVPFAAAATAVAVKADEASTAMDISSPIKPVSMTVYEPQQEKQDEAQEEQEIALEQEDIAQDQEKEAEEPAAEEEEAVDEEQVDDQEEQAAVAEEEENDEEDSVSDIEEDQSVSASVVSETAASQPHSHLNGTADSYNSKTSLSSVHSGTSQQSGASNAHNSEPVKKPNNLLNLASASSFLDKPSSKPVVPALLKAKQLKEQEELKEQKRKEMKAAKTNANPSSSAHHTVSSAKDVSSANNNNNNNTNSNSNSSSNNPVRSPWGKVAKGISKVAENVNNKMGLFSKKPAATTTTSSVAAAAAAESGSAKMPVKQLFDVRAIESKTSPTAAAPSAVSVSVSSTSTSSATAAAATVETAPVVPVSSAAAAAPEQQPVVVKTETAAVGGSSSGNSVSVTAPAAVSASTPTPTATSAAALPPKSAIKEILANYNQAMASQSVVSPAAIKPLVPLTSASVIAASTHTTTTTTSSAVPSVPSIAAPVVSMPMVAPAPSVSTTTNTTTTSMLKPAEAHVLREKPITASTTVPPVVATSAAAAAAAAAVVSKPQQVVEEEEEEEDDYDPANNYQIEDTPDSDDSDGGSGTDDEQESDKKKQLVPEWARGDQLREALERQYGLNGHIPLDPDVIFPEVQSCSLEEIFGRREGVNRKYATRTSSAHWDADELTLVEKRQYRVHMGYDTQSSAATTSAAVAAGAHRPAVKMH